MTKLSSGALHAITIDDVKDHYEPMSNREMKKLKKKNRNQAGMIGHSATKKYYSPKNTKIQKGLYSGLR